MSNLMLHAGASRGDRSMIQNLPLPAATQTWCPVSHEDFDGAVRDGMDRAGVVIHDSDYGVSRMDDDGYRHRLFFVHTTYDELQDGGRVRMCVGGRNSTDQSFAAGMVFGQRVFVCDNLALSGEFTFKRKHTAHIMQDLPGLISQGFERYFVEKVNAAKIVERFQNAHISDRAAKAAIHDACAAGVAGWTKAPLIYREYKSPTFEHEAPDTVWMLQQAVTQIHKSYNIMTAADRSLKLHTQLVRAFAPDLMTASN